MGTYASCCLEEKDIVDQTLINEKKITFFWKSQNISKFKALQYVEWIIENKAIFKYDLLDKDFLKNNFFNIFFGGKGVGISSMQKLFNFLYKLIVHQNPCYILSSLLFLTEWNNDYFLYTCLETLYNEFDNDEFNFRESKKEQKGSNEFFDESSTTAETKRKLDSKYVSLRNFDFKYIKILFYFFVKIISYYSYEFFNKELEIGENKKTTNSNNKFDSKDYRKMFSNYIIFQCYLKPFDEYIRQNKILNYQNLSKLLDNSNTIKKEDEGLFYFRKNEAVNDKKEKKVDIIYTRDHSIIRRLLVQLYEENFISKGIF